MDVGHGYADAFLRAGLRLTPARGQVLRPEDPCPGMNQASSVLHQISYPHRWCVKLMLPLLTTYPDERRCETDVVPASEQRTDLHQVGNAFDTFVVHSTA